MKMDLADDKGGFDKGKGDRRAIFVNQRLRLLEKRCIVHRLIGTRIIVAI